MVAGLSNRQFGQGMWDIAMPPPLRVWVVTLPRIKDTAVETVCDSITLLRALQAESGAAVENWLLPQKGSETLASAAIETNNTQRYGAGVTVKDITEPEGKTEMRAIQEDTGAAHFR